MTSLGHSTLFQVSFVDTQTWPYYTFPQKSSIFTLYPKCFSTIYTMVFWPWNRRCSRLGPRVTSLDMLYIKMTGQIHTMVTVKNGEGDLMNFVDSAVGVMLCHVSMCRSLKNAHSPLIQSGSWLLLLPLFTKHFSPKSRSWEPIQRQVGSVPPSFKVHCLTSGFVGIEAYNSFWMQGFTFLLHIVTKLK